MITFIMNYITKSKNSILFLIIYCFNKNKCDIDDEDLYPTSFSSSNVNKNDNHNSDPYISSSSTTFRYKSDPSDLCKSLKRTNLSTSSVLQRNNTGDQLESFYPTTFMISINRHLIKNSLKVKLNSNKKYSDNSTYYSNMKLMNKQCCNEKCNRNLGSYSTWYCYNGNTYCTIECRMYSIYGEQYYSKAFIGFNERQRLLDKSFSNNQQNQDECLDIIDNSDQRDYIYINKISESCHSSKVSYG